MTSYLMRSARLHRRNPLEHIVEAHHCVDAGHKKENVGIML